MGPSVHVIDPKSFVRLAFGQPNKPFGKYDLTPGRWPDVWGLRPQTEGLRPIGGLRPLVWLGKVIMIWYGLVWYGMVWFGMGHRPSWYSMVWYGMVWFGMVWFAMVWFGMVWYGMVDVASLSALPVAKVDHRCSKSIADDRCRCRFLICFASGQSRSSTLQVDRRRWTSMSLPYQVRLG